MTYYFVDYALKSIESGIYKIITRRFDKEPKLKEILDFKIKESFQVKFKIYKRYYNFYEFAYYKQGWGDIVNITPWIDLDSAYKDKNSMKLIKNRSYK